MTQEALPDRAVPGEAEGGQEEGGGGPEAAKLPVRGGQAAEQAGQAEAGLQAGLSDRCH